MDDFLSIARKTEIAGIAAEHWIGFFRIHSEPKDHAKIDKWLERRLARMSSGITGEDGRRARRLLQELADLLGAGE